MKKLLIIAIVFGLANTAFAQCPTDQEIDTKQAEAQAEYDANHPSLNWNGWMDQDYELAAADQVKADQDYQDTQDLAVWLFNTYQINPLDEAVINDMLLELAEMKNDAALELQLAHGMNLNAHSDHLNAANKLNDSHSQQAAAATLPPMDPLYMMLMCNAYDLAVDSKASSEAAMYWYDNTSEPDDCQSDHIDNNFDLLVEFYDYREVVEDAIYDLVPGV